MITKTYLTRGNLLKLRALRKQAHIERCSVQAKRAKSELIAKGKGNNGLSMNLDLLHHHATIS